MKKTKKGKDKLSSVYLPGIILFLFGLGTLLLVLGGIKSAEFNKTEKIKMTFTEPVVSVSKGTDAEDRTKYTMYVKYEYNGETRTYSYTKQYQDSVGKMITFTKYFLPDGTELINKGKSLTGAGIGSFMCSIPWVIFYIMYSRYIKKTENDTAA